MSISAAAASTIAAPVAAVVVSTPDTAAAKAVTAAYGAGKSGDATGHDAGNGVGNEAGRDALPKEMTTAVQELRDALRTTPFGIQFEIDDVTHKVITKVVDRNTGELIRQLPSEEMVRIAHAMNKLQGLLVQQSA